jgi:hypothetical protein
MGEKKSYTNFDISLISNSQLSFKKGAFVTITGAFLLGTGLLGLDAYFFPEKREYEGSRVIETIKSDRFENISLVNPTIFKNNVSLQNIVEVPLYFNFISSSDLKQNQNLSKLIDETTRLISYSPNNSSPDSIEDLVLKDKNQSISGIVSDINNIYSLNGLVYYELPLDLFVENFSMDDLKKSHDFQIFEKVYDSSDLSERAIKGILFSAYEDNIDSIEKKNIYAKINYVLKGDFGFKGDIKLGFELKNVERVGEDLINNYTYFVKCYGTK